MTRWRLLPVLALLLTLAPSGRAGVYFSAERPGLPLPVNPKGVNLRKAELDPWIYKKSATGEVEREVKPHYKALLDYLEARQRAGLLLPSERIDLGAAYLRLRRYREAKGVLEEAQRLGTDESPLGFLVLANLASAYHGMAEHDELLDAPDKVRYLELAVSTQKNALARWPAVTPDWSTLESRVNRRSETFYLRLLELRLAERRARPTGGFEQPDNLFDGAFVFVGRNGRPTADFLGPDGLAFGEYEAGRVPWGVWDRLPPDAIQIAIQLVLWYPNDPRLLWLLGEIFNALGQVPDAYFVLNGTIEGYDLGRLFALRIHRRILQEANDTWKVRGELEQNPFTTLALFAALAPRGFLPVPGAVVVGPEAVWPVLAVEYEQRLQQQSGEPPGEPRPPRPQVDWQAVLVGFLAGLIVGMLALAQIRQWRQRGQSSLTERRLQDG